jgi:hypothetical protein
MMAFMMCCGMGMSAMGRGRQGRGRLKALEEVQTHAINTHTHTHTHTHTYTHAHCDIHTTQKLRHAYAHAKGWHLPPTHSNAHAPICDAVPHIGILVPDVHLHSKRCTTLRVQATPHVIKLLQVLLHTAVPPWAGLSCLSRRLNLCLGL